MAVQNLACQPEIRIPPLLWLCMFDLQPGATRHVGNVGVRLLLSPSELFDLDCRPS